MTATLLGLSQKTPYERVSILIVRLMNPDEEHSYHVAGGHALFDSSLERQEKARESRETEQHKFNGQQVALSRGNLVTQIALAVLGCVGLAASLYGVHQARVSAEAAASAAQIARETLNEMRNGGGAQDTHTLALQSVAQGKIAQELATATSHQAEASQITASASRDLARSNKQFSERSLSLIADEAGALQTSAVQARESLEFSKKIASQTLELMQRQADAAASTAEGMQKADQRAREQFAESERPMVLAAFGSKPLASITADGRVYVILPTTVKNIGRSAALNVQYRVQVRADGLHSKVTRMNQLEDTCTERVFGMDVPGVVVPPSEDKRFVESSMVDGGPVLKDAIGTTQTMHVAFLHLGTCVSYRDRFTDKVHRAAELFDFFIIFSADDLNSIRKLKNPGDIFLLPDADILFKSETMENGIAD